MPTTCGSLRLDPRDEAAHLGRADIERRDQAAARPVHRLGGRRGRPAWLAAAGALPRLWAAWRAAPRRSRSCVFRRRASFLGWRGILWRLRCDAHDQPVGQAHVDRLHVALENGCSRSSAARSAQAPAASSSGSSTSMPLSSRRFQRRPPTRTAAVDARREIGLARQHRRAAPPRAPRASSPTTIGSLAKRSRSVDRDHRAVAVDQVDACRHAATTRAARARQGGHRACRAGGARSTPSGPRAGFRAAAWRAPGRPRGSACRGRRRARRGSSRGRSLRGPRPRMSATRKPSAALGVDAGAARRRAQRRDSGRTDDRAPRRRRRAAKHDQRRARRMTIRRRRRAVQRRPTAHACPRMGRGAQPSHAAFSTIQAHQLVETDAGMAGDVGHQRGRGHAGLGVDLEQIDPAVARRRCRRSADRRG